MEDWKREREEIKNKLYEKEKKRIEELKTELLGADTWEETANFYWQLSEKYKMLYYGYAEEPNIFKNTPREEYYRHLVKMYLWNAVYYREKCLRLIKKNELIEINDGFFTDVGLKYKYFVEYEYNEIKEEDFSFERHGDSKNENINLVINDLVYAKQGMYHKIKYYEKEKNHEELYCWSEVMGDIYLMIQLLLMKGGRKDLLDNARLALHYYKKSREHLKFFAEPTVAYTGIYGLPYQNLIFDPLLKIFEFKGYSQSCVDKIQFIETRMLKKESGMDYIEYRESSYHNNKDILNNRIEILLNQHNILKYRGLDFEDWKTVIIFVHDRILSHNYNMHILNNQVRSWRREDDMQKWVQGIIDQFLKQREEPSFFSRRETIIGGGQCDHHYKNVIICDKWKRDSNAKHYPTKIHEIIDKSYEDHYEQVKGYAQDNKFAVLIVVDSREQTRNTPPDMVKDCYTFKTNETDGIITAIFILQVSDITPSKRK